MSETNSMLKTLMPGKKIAIYSRKSKFTEKGDSIVTQINLCKTVAKSRYEHDIADDDILVFTDEGYSGKNTERPQFQQMMALVKKNALQEIVCYRIDRVSRNIIDFHEFTEQLKEHNASFLSITESCDTSTPMGRAMLSICSVFAQLERETIAARIRDNMLELAKSGRWLGGVPPTGYRSTQLVDKITESGKARKAFKLEIIPDEANLVKLVFAKFLETRSLTQVETYFLQNHIKTRNGKEFVRFAIKNILQNPVYAANDEASWRYFESFAVTINAEQSQFDGKHGIMVYNKTQQNTKQGHLVRDMEEWVIAVGKHKPLVSGEDWVSAQTLLLQNKSKSYRKQRSNVALLSGLLFCGRCGSYMRPKQSQRLNAEGELIYNYLCETKERSHMANCAMKNPLGNKLDELVCQAVKKLAMDQSAFRTKLEAAEEMLNRDANLYDETLKSLKSKWQENEGAIKQLVDSLLTAGNTPAKQYITEEIDRRHDENVGIRNSIQEYERLAQNQLMETMQFELLRQQMLTISLSVDEMSIDEKRAALKSVIRKVVWDGENAHIFFFGANAEEKATLAGGDEGVDFSGITVEAEGEPLRDS
jgi:site-specific DNA recombinase